jgi:hypothetical protein
MDTFKVALFPYQTVLFPGTLIPIRVSEGAHRAVVDHCISTDSPFGVVMVEVLGEGRAVLAEVGTLALVQEHADREDGSIEVVGVGSDRFRIVRVLSDSPFVTAEVCPLYDEVGLSPEELNRALAQLSERFHRYAGLVLTLPTESMEIQLPSDPVARLNLICSALMVPLRQKQVLLEELRVERRIEIATSIVHRETTELEALRLALGLLQGEEDPLTAVPFSLN